MANTKRIATRMPELSDLSMVRASLNRNSLFVDLRGRVVVGCPADRCFYTGDADIQIRASMDALERKPWLVTGDAMAEDMNRWLDRLRHNDRAPMLDVELVYHHYVLAGGIADPQSFKATASARGMLAQGPHGKMMFNRYSL